MDWTDEGGHVPVPNALTGNVVGLNGPPFPAWVELSIDGDIQIINFGPIQAEHFVDLLISDGAQYAFLYDLGVSDFRQDLRGEWVERPLAETAAGIGVPIRVEDGGNIVIDTGDLELLLAAANTHQVSLLDLPELPGDLSTLWATTSGHSWHSDGPTLRKVPTSRVFLDIHDDCYVHLELRADQDAVWSYVQRIVWLLAGTAANGRDISVSPPPAGILRQLLGSEGLFRANQTDVSATTETIEVPFCRSKHRIAEVTEPTDTLMFHLASRSWTIT
jgi:hypothetical protein